MPCCTIKTSSKTVHRFLIPYLDAGLKQKKKFWLKMFPRPNPIQQPYLSHTQFKSSVFIPVIRNACPPNLKKCRSKLWSIIKHSDKKCAFLIRGDIWLLKVTYRGIFILPLQWHHFHLCQIQKNYVYKLFKMYIYNNIIISTIRQISYQTHEIRINRKIICTTELAQKNSKVACRYIFSCLMRHRGGNSAIKFIDSYGH